MFKIGLARDIALGNGTRRRGEVLASCQGTDPGTLQAQAYELTGCNAVALEELQTTLGCELELADGVEPCELLTALRNPHLCECVPVDAEVPREADDEQPKPKTPKAPKPA